MANISHLWNITKFLSKTQTSQSNELRNHYIQCCRELSNEVELPKQIFGPGSMCCHCGSLWNTIDHKVRIAKGKSLSTSMKKLLRAKNKRNLSPYQEKLMRKCINNQSNKLVITCSNCHMDTKIKLNKPQRLKVIKKQQSSETTGITPKRKKKRNKDKNAGLLINSPVTPTSIQNSGKKKCNSNNTPTLKNTKDQLKRFNTPTSVISSRKINLSKLKGMVDATITPSKKTNLHSFLTELG